MAVFSLSVPSLVEIFLHLSVIKIELTRYPAFFHSSLVFSAAFFLFPTDCDTQQRSIRLHRNMNNGQQHGQLPPGYAGGPSHVPRGMRYALPNLSQACLVPESDVATLLHC